MMNRQTIDTSLESPRARAAMARAEEIEQHVERRASGRVYGLRVECSTDKLVLRGRCRTYHAKQLAQQAALELAAPSTRVVNEIVIA
jgi:hypothetical protein